MTEEQHHAVYKWFEYSGELQRERAKRRHALAIFLGSLTGLGLVYVLVGLFS